MQPFGEDAPASIPGPDWLTAKRADAQARLATMAMPSWEEEVWRYAPIDDLDLARFTPGLGSDAAADAVDTEAILAEFPNRSGAAVVVDGVVVHIEGDTIARLSEADADDGSIGCVMDEATDCFSEMNSAYMTDPLIVRAPGGRDVEAPVVVVNLITTEGTAVFPRLIVRCGSDASIKVLDIMRSTGDITAFVAPVVELDNADAARLSYLNVQELGDGICQIASQVSQVGSQGTLKADSAAFGGDYARLRADCRLIGRGADGHLGAVYFGNDTQTLDFRTFQDHIAPDTTSDLLFKGVLDDKSRSVYSGLIRVGKEARGTNAFQTNRNIKLSDDAWAESVPNLEIETDDVRCSHASTVGPIDEEQRFYLQSRGVPTSVADRLIVAGFFNEVIDALAVPQLADDLRAQIDAKLEASSV